MVTINAIGNKLEKTILFLNKCIKIQELIAFVGGNRQQSGKLPISSPTEQNCEFVAGFPDCPIHLCQNPALMCSQQSSSFLLYTFGIEQINEGDDNLRIGEVYKTRLCLLPAWHKIVPIKCKILSKLCCSILFCI